MRTKNQKFIWIRNALGITQEEMGRAIGVGKSSISNIENDTRDVTNRYIQELRSVYNVNEDWLKDDTDLDKSKMFLAPDQSFLKSLQNQHHLSQSAISILQNFFKLTDVEQDSFIDVAKKIFQLDDTVQSTEYRDLPITEVSTQTIEGYTDDKDISQMPTSVKFRYVPKYGDVAAGLGAYTENDIESYEAIPESWLGNKLDEYMILTVSGSSMEPALKDGDDILIRVQDDANSEDWAVVVIHDTNDKSTGDYGFIKRIRKNLADHTIELISLNEDYEPLIFSLDDIDRKVFIRGIIKKVLRDYK